MTDTATAAASVTEPTSQHEGGLGPAFAAMLHRIDQRERREYERGYKNMMLAPTLELYWALQRGEAVPIDQLNPEAVERYGLRRKEAS